MTESRRKQKWGTRDIKEIGLSLQRPPSPKLGYFNSSSSNSKTRWVAFRL